MTPEAAVVLGTWVTPAILVALVPLFLGAMRRLEDRLNRRIDDLGGRIDKLDTRLGAVERGQAKLEGLLEGLREAIGGRRDAA